jgi:protein-S-isoprenylcysteine O-methyltransferase Ste14
MASSPVSAGPVREIPTTHWQKFCDFLIHRRVPITGALFAVLLLEDVWSRTSPHNLANLSDYKVLLGLGLVLSGLALRSWAAGTLHKRRVLTTSGPYSLVRHPLYLGSFMMMIGFCLLIDDRENIYFVLGPILGIYLARTLHEEKILAAAFPEQWAEFARKVPRFFPRRLPKKLFSTWSLNQWINNREYQAVSAVFLGLAALQVWQFLENR